MDTLSWTTLQSHFDANIPFVLPMGGSRGVRLAWEPKYQRLSLQLPTASVDDPVLSPFTEMSITLRRIEDASFLEITTTRPALYPAFHQLAVLATSSFEPEGSSAAQAFENAVECWQDLLLQRPLLTDFAQQGLFGELTVLNALVKKHGAHAVGMWVAYSPAISSRHDFRFDDIEIEVKTTKRRRRIHQINGITQLLASPGSSLYVLSLKYESASPGNGMSLPEIVEVIRSNLAPGSLQRKDFEEKASRAKYRAQDSQHYKQRFQLVDLPRIMAVDADFPKITPATLSTSIPSSLLNRIDHVTYEVDLEGMGSDTESSQFQSIFQGAQIE